MATVVGAAGSGVAGAAALDLSTPDAVDAYLASHGIDPATVTRQFGPKNYAGPASGCPGRGWNCTTATRVVQIAQADGENRVVCGPDGTATDSGGVQTCVIVQTGADNDARCSERSDTEVLATQFCSITQTGTSNRADVAQTIDQKVGPVQESIQTAVVIQVATERNQLHAEQVVRQETKTGAAQAQNAHQRLTVEQTATGAGDNLSHVRQHQDQKAFGGSTQSQNVSASPIGDCNPGGFFSPSDPNECAQITQASVAGRNANGLTQTLDQNAKTDAVATQQQGSFAGGVDGDINQTTATGSSTNNADQDKSQRLAAPPGAIQTQLDPVGCCGVSQLGGTGNVEDIDQRSSQSASEGAAAFQQIRLVGTSNSPVGLCSIHQRAKTDADAASQNVAFEPCPPVVVITECAAVSPPPDEFTGECVTTTRPVVVPLVEGGG